MKNKSSIAFFLSLCIMIRQDYFIRLLKEFAAALQRAMAEKEYDKRREAIKDLYTQFVGDYQFYHTSTIDEVMKEAESFPEEERLMKLEMLAELYFAEADYLSNPFKEVILNKAYSLYLFIDKYSNDYSIDRKHKLETLKELLP